MRMEEVVGQNVARLRKDKWALSQAELGQKIGAECGRAWSRQTVSAAEKGDRAFTVSDLVMLAFVFQVDSAALLHLPTGVQSFEVGGRTYRRDELAPISWQSHPTKNGMAALSDELFGLSRQLDDLIQAADEIDGRAKNIYLAATRLRSQQSLEALGAAMPHDYEEETDR